MTHQNVILQIGTTQIQITILQTSRLCSGAILNDLKRRRLRLVEDAQLFHGNLNITGRNLAVARGTHAYHATGGNHVLTAQSERFLKHGLIRILIERQLHNTGAVTQVNENQLTQIALTLYPTKHRNLAAGIFLTEHAAIIGAMQTFNRFCHSNLPYSFGDLFKIRHAAKQTSHTGQFPIQQLLSQHVIQAFFQLHLFGSTGTHILQLSTTRL